MTTTNTYYKNNYEELVEDMVYEFTENNPIDYEDFSEDDMDEFLEEVETQLTKEEFYHIFDKIDEILYERLEKKREEEEEEWFRYLNTLPTAEARYLLYN